MKCNKCNEILRKNDNFCTNCGSKVESNNLIDTEEQNAIRQNFVPYDLHMLILHITWLMISNFLILAPLFIGIDPLSISLVEVMLGSIFLFAWIYIIFADTNQLRKAQILPPSRWWILIIPVYLWKRSNVLNKSKTVFWIFISIMIIDFLFAILLELGRIL